MRASEDTALDSAAGELWVCDLDVVPYPLAVRIQQRIRARRQAGTLPDTLLLLEHPPVYTRGRRSQAQELPLSEDFYRARGIELHWSDRGGRLTYHAPGQLVGYPIMRIGDVKRHVRTMEQAIIAALAEHGIGGRSRCQEGPDYTGVWVAERKIASIGVHVSRSVSTHGFAVNVTNDLEPFAWVIACGLGEVAMTSLELELGVAPPDALDAFRRSMAAAYCAAHGRSGRPVSPAELEIEDLLGGGASSQRAVVA